MEGDVRWHHGQTLAAGQVAEFKVWAELVRQSRGALHVFLPLRDVGIDGVLHRLGDGAYIAVQVKGRMAAGRRDGRRTSSRESGWRNGSV